MSKRRQYIVMYNVYLQPNLAQSTNLPSHTQATTDTFAAELLHKKNILYYLFRTFSTCYTLNQKNQTYFPKKKLLIFNII